MSKANPSVPTPPQVPAQPQIPTQKAIAEVLSTAVASILVSGSQSGFDGILYQSIGKILTSLTFGRGGTDKATFTMLIERTSQEAHERYKVESLRASIITDDTASIGN